MDLPKAMSWLAERTHGVLITLRRDGRPQSSDISYYADGDVVQISVTADRAKTANARRDPRVVLHVSDRDAWSYVSLEATAELTPVAADPGDATCDALVRYYEMVTGGPHPDWDDYRAAMVRDRRLLITLYPKSAVGILGREG